ncbi:MAG: nuclear transport factor 2 family protein [Acidobacteria bacterium]|nr:nuclear transport factor 2 family protein [Acidobacteriota bacterium]
MPDAGPIAVVLAFEKKLNAGDVDGIVALMATDGVFIDSMGAKITGHANLRQAWTEYFRMVPDYRISHSEVFSQGATVALFGEARGTLTHDGLMHRENAWSTPAAWRAVVEGGRIRVWQVFADNEPVRQIMRRFQEP